MINLDEIKNFDQLVKEIEIFLNENFPILIIVSLIFLALLVYSIKFVFDRRSNIRKDQIEKWKTLKAKNPKLTDKVTLKVYPFSNKKFEVKGDIHVIDSSISTKEYKIDSVINKNIEKIDFELEILKSKKPKKAQDLGKIKELEGEKEEILLKSLEIDKEETLVIKQKTETYVSFDKKNNELVGIRLNNLLPTQNILSVIGFLNLSSIDPRRSNWILYLILGISFTFQFILIWSIVNEEEPTFLFSSDMWGWYFALAVLLGSVVYIIKVLMGFYAIMYAYQITKEDVKLVTNRGEEFTININVYWLKTYFYPSIDVSEVLDINTNDLAEKINNENTRLISELSSKIASLKSDNEFLKTLINKKSAVIDTMQERIVIERGLGYYEGREDNQATPTIQEFDGQSNFDWNTIITKAIPFIFGLILLMVMVVGGKYVADSIQLDSAQTTLLVGGMVLFGVFFLLIAVRGLIESTSRKAF